MSKFSEFLRKSFPRQTSKRKSRRTRRSFSVEPLESRIMPAVTASFSAATGVLSVIGDNLVKGLHVLRRIRLLEGMTG